jgi:hypothetical protein
LAQGEGKALRYPKEIAPFLGIPSGEAFDAATLTRLIEPDETVFLMGPRPAIPPGWELGALGVVEEERPPRSARLRAFFPASTSADTLLAGLGDYLDGLRTLGYGVVDDPEITRVTDPVA